MENRIFQQLFDTFMTYKGVGFVSLQYRSKESGEVSKRLMNIGAKIETAKKSDILLLNKGMSYVPSERYAKADWDMALLEVKKSLIEPNEVRSNGQKNAYVTLNEDNGSVKFNMNTSEVYLFGKSEKKEVIEAGVYKTVVSRAKTIAKKEIGRTMKSTKFRTLIIKNLVGTVKINKQIINIDGVDREEDVIEIVEND